RRRVIAQANIITPNGRPQHCGRSSFFVAARCVQSVIWPMKSFAQSQCPHSQVYKISLIAVFSTTEGTISFNNGFLFLKKMFFS
ncbi:MAG: hypothetical protein II519_07670, partial [Muribaculaceae bacterium]|nr:hypothetical protein [Muribaculaceae bacterium]